MTFRHVVCAVTMGILASALACSSSSSSSSNDAPLCAPPTGCPNPDPATTQLTTPTVSLKTDVIPIFQTSCSLSSSCHQLQTAGPSLLYLGGGASAAADPAGIIAATVNVASVELASMPYVTPGDPTKSFLMHKMDGDECQYATQCGATPQATCGDPMPKDACALDGATRDTVRRWIAQGAQNN